MPSTSNRSRAVCSSLRPPLGTSLLAKGSFRQVAAWPAAENVRVNVEDRLSGGFALVEDESEVSTAVFVGKLLRGGHHSRE